MKVNQPMRDSQLFDKAVELYFKKIADRLGTELKKIQDGIFEIVTQKFALRLRLDTGHSRGMNVILRRISNKPFDETDPTDQLGVLTVANFENVNSEATIVKVNSEETFLQQAEFLANLSFQFLLPYLLGLRDNFEEVQRHALEKGQKSIDQINAYRFPKNVREEWI